MKDLEQFIINNRKELNDAIPPDSIWHQIETTLDRDFLVHKRKSTLRYRTFFSIAALFILICTATVIIYQAQQRSSLDYQQINPVLAQKQMTYSTLVNQKRDVLSSLAVQDPKLYQEFTLVIDTMQRNYKQLKMELSQSPNKERTLEAMINNLHMQLQILNQQLEILNYLHEQHEKKTPYGQI